MKGKIIMIIGILLGILFINSGLNKFLNYMPMPEMSSEAMNTFSAFVATGWLMQLIGISEIIGGALLLLSKYRALGAIILFPIIIGIFLFHVVEDPNGIVMAAVILILDAVIIWGNKEKYMPMIS